MNKNLLFIILLLAFLFFIIQKYPRLCIFIILCIGLLFVFNKYFVNPHDFINYMSNMFTNITETFDFKNDDEIYTSIPILTDYKNYLSKTIKFVSECTYTSNDNAQKELISNKLHSQMHTLFINVYNTINDKQYSNHSYNKVLLSEREFANTLDTFIFLPLNENETYNIELLQKEFTILNTKLNKYLIDKVNDISPNDYNITTSRLPYLDEPQSSNTYEDMQYLLI